MISTHVSNEARREEATSTENRREEGIKRLGTYMLSGWVLTDSPCKSCFIPTMRKKDRSIVEFCVLCQDPNNPWPLESGSFGTTTSATTLAMASDEANEKLKRVAGEESFKLTPSELIEIDESVLPISTKLGKKMLQGWTLMQECCNQRQCYGVPLMRNHNGVLICLNCNQTSLVNGNQEANTPIVTESRIAENPEIYSIPQKSENMDKSAFVSDGLDGNIFQSRRAIEQKILFLSTELCSISNSLEIVEYCKAIEACASSISSLNKLVKQGLN